MTFKNGQIPSSFSSIFYLKVLMYINVIVWDREEWETGGGAWGGRGGEEKSFP